MGLSVILETERGERLDRIDDPTNGLHRLLPDPDDESFPLLRFVDWYGDTIFNSLQASQLVKELERLKHDAATAEDTELLDQILGLAVRCENESHTYLRFEGD